MKCRGYLVPIAILASVIQNGECGKNVYCHASKNEYYLPAGNMCKKCDRCMPGLELVSDEEATFENSNDHGAMGCKHCVVCKEGYYNTKWTYRGCRKCRNCEKKGKETIKECTRKSNAECRKRLKTEKIESNSPAEYIGMMTTEEVDIINIPARAHNAKGLDLSIVVAVVGTLLAVTLPVVIILLINKYLPLQICKGQKPSRNTSFSTGLDDDAAEMQDVEEDGEMVATIPFLKTVEFRHDIKEECETPTEKHLIFISKRIAAKKLYWQIGVHLEVGENNISIIEDEHRDDLVRISFKVLQKWMHMFAEQSTVSRLLVALDAVSRHDIVMEFYKEFQNIFRKNDPGGNNDPAELCRF